MEPARPVQGEGGLPGTPHPVTCGGMPRGCLGSLRVMTGEMHWQHSQALLPVIARCCPPIGPGSTEQGTQVELHHPRHCSGGCCSTNCNRSSGVSLLQQQLQPLFGTAQAPGRASSARQRRGLQGLQGPTARSTQNGCAVTPGAPKPPPVPQGEHADLPPRAPSLPVPCAASGGGGHVALLTV